MNRIDQQAIGQLIESNRQIARAVDKIEENLKVLNDHNILHYEQSMSAHKSFEIGQQQILEKLQVMTAKYWWIIVSLIGAVFMLAGVKEAAQFLFVG